ncbi:MAG: fatty acid hydroxylase family protein [Deltaproteobacteria bacterium]|nr:MAG: fatty acid hydroxylase family protein [Deltaproteobacteria bacterium]
MTTPPRGTPVSLRTVTEIFFRHRSPRLLVTAVAVFLGLRARLGPPTVWDAAIVLALVAVHPLTEWLIHVFVLHARPKRILGRKVDLALARYHRAHHRLPNDPRWQFIPIREGLLPALVVEIAAVWLLLPTWPLRLTALATMAGLGLWYEWIHYLVHSRYRPRSRFIARLYRHHRLHHFKNEHYWFGVSMTSGDRLLGTMPDHRTVPTSPTCRTLGLDPDGPASGPPDSSA